MSMVGETDWRGGSCSWKSWSGGTFISAPSWRLETTRSRCRRCSSARIWISSRWKVSAASGDVVPLRSSTRDSSSASRTVRSSSFIFDSSRSALTARQ